MPIYEYECRKCSFRFELRRRFGEDGGSHCPRCLSEARRVFCPVPIFFKGPGFYVTDNATGGRGRFDSKRDGDSPAGIGKGTETSKDGEGGVGS
jgi:putative FmdB family regulatory protein